MQTIHRITKLFEFLSRYKDGLGINEISQSLDFPLSTTHRMLNSLRKDGYVTQDELTKRYKLGVKILSLAINQLNNMDIIKISKPIIEELSTKYGQLVYLSVLENNRVVCIDMVNNSKRTKFYVQIGASMPVYCAASGKAIGAYLDESKLDDIIKDTNIIKFTLHTIIDDYEIKGELCKVKKQGYAVCDEEMELGVNAVAVPVFGRDEQVYASITIMLMKQLKYDEDKIVHDLKQAANKISKFLGYVE